jgi:hypothetical protein
MTAGSPRHRDEGRSVTGTAERRTPAAELTSRSAGTRRGPAIPWGLVGALAAASIVIFLSPGGPRPPPVGRMTPTSAWPHVQRADMPGTVPDGPAYRPLFFLDARVSVGTAPAPDGAHARLLLRGADGAIRELRRLPLERNPQFTAFTAAGDELVWAESDDAGPTRLWAVDVHTAAPAREVTADTGNALFYYSQYDIVAADGRVYWAAAAPGVGTDTEVRSVALTGGPVDVRTESGTWALTAWPWLVNGVADAIGVTRLRNLLTHDEIGVTSAGTELTACSPTWCRQMVMSEQGPVRFDLAHPDGTARRRVAGSTAGAAITDVAPLDRFEAFVEPDANSDLTGTQRLLVYDLATRRTVDLGPGTRDVLFRGGVLWWSTGDRDSPLWHAIDLRTA